MSKPKLNFAFYNISNVYIKNDYEKDLILYKPLTNEILYKIEDDMYKKCKVYDSSIVSILNEDIALFGIQQKHIDILNSVTSDCVFYTKNEVDNAIQECDYKIWKTIEYKK